MNKLEKAVVVIPFEGGAYIQRTEPQTASEDALSDSERVILHLWGAKNNTLTLDSKIKDGEIVEEPQQKDFVEFPNSQTYNVERYKKALEEYQKLPTLRECLKELPELRSRVSDWEKYYNETERGEHPDTIRLQDEKQKVKELEEENKISSESLLSSARENNGDSEYIKLLEKALDTAIVGLEWWNGSYPQGSSPADAEHIAKFKKLLNQ